MSLSKIFYPLLSTGLKQEDRKCSEVTAKLLTGTLNINTNQQTDQGLFCLHKLFLS